MKILKIFGIVIALHLVLGGILVGCSSMKKQPSRPADTVPPPELAPVDGVDESSPVINSMNEGVPAVPATVRARPTRPASSQAPQTFQPAPVAGTAPDMLPPPAYTPEPEMTDYTVVKGDSLWTVAKKHGITVAQLSGANNLPRNAQLKLGQKLQIPAKAPAAKTETAVSETSGRTYKVLPGDNLSMIAKRNKTTVAAIKSLNGLKSDALSAGQVIQLPEPSATTTTASYGSAISSDGLTYTVKPGDMLGPIARRYQVSLADLATLNNIADPGKLRAGQVLKIPAGGKVPAARTAKKATAPKPAPKEKAADKVPPPADETAPILTPAAEAPAPAPTPAPAAEQAPVESLGEVPAADAGVPAEPPPSIN